MTPGVAPKVLIILVALCAFPEAIALLPGVFEGGRENMVRFLAFWPGLLKGQGGFYPMQSWLMFLTYGFVHAGIFHFLFNMITLISLGRPLVRELGEKRFLLLYLISLVGGALGYGLLSPYPNPMVGASGALFGLAGALLWMRFRLDWLEESFLFGMRGLVLPVAFLIGMNVVFYVALNGVLAWETHLGGFLAGVFATILLWRGT